MKKFLLLLLFAGCAPQMAPRETASNHAIIEEFRIALMDMRQTCNAQKLDIQLLEEKLAKIKPSPQVSPLLVSLENKVRELEKMQEKIRSDLHELSTHANQTTQALVQYRTQINALDERINDVSKLKQTLTSISKAMHTPNAKSYVVKAGDTLDKIARAHNTSVDAIKKLNSCGTTIFAGQELKIPE